MAKLVSENCLIYAALNYELGIPLGESRCCGGLFADDIVLFASSRTKLGC